MKKSGLLLAACCLILSWAEARSRTVHVVAPPLMRPYLEQAARHFQHQFPRHRLSWSLHESGDAFALLIDGKADVAILTHSPTENELRALSAHHIKTMTLARDALVPVVSFEVFMNGLRDLSLRDIERIYKGTKTNWAEVGGSSDTIHVFDLPDGHSARALFLSVIFAGAKARTLDGAKRLETEQQIIDAVATSSGAIAYASSSQTNPKVRGLGLRAEGNRILYPTPNAVLSLEYPLTRNLSAAAAAEPKAGAKDFLNFMVSPLGEDLLRDAKFVPLINY